MSVTNPYPNIDWRLDDMAVSTRDHDEFAQVLDFVDSSKNTKYYRDVTTKDIVFDAIPVPMDAKRIAQKYDLDETLALECGQLNGSHLVAIRTDGNGNPLEGKWAQNYTVCKTAWSSITNAAKLWGAALLRMDPVKMAETLNNGMEVARGNSLMLVRFGKLFAIHSDGYVPMPVSTLFERTEEIISQNLGKIAFMNGYYEHSFCTAMWRLPDASNGIIEAYEKALMFTEVKLKDEIKDYTPGLLLHTSDTQASAARLMPIFITSAGNYICLTEGVSVRHEKNSGNKEGLELYEEKISDIYSMFMASADKAAELANIKVKHPANTILNLAKKFDIPKKYACMAKDALIDEIGENEPCAAFDIVASLSNITVLACDGSASATFVLDLQEKIARVIRLNDWDEYDTSSLTW